MKRTALALALIFTLLISIIGVHVVKVAEADPILITHYADISIQSPQNRTYTTEPVLLNFTVKTNFVLGAFSYFYLLDSQDRQASVKVEEIQDEIVAQDFLAGQSVLPKLPDGPHNLTVFLGYVDPNGVIQIQIQNADELFIGPFSATVHFSIDTTSQPEPFPTTLVVASVVLVAVIGIGLLVYFKKRQRDKSP